MIELKPKQLARDLRQIHALYEKGPTLKMFSSGICLAYSRLLQQNLREGDAYGEIDHLLRQVEQTYTGGTYLGGGEIDFQTRATMCLLLAEWLETEVIGHD